MLRIEFSPKAVKTRYDSLKGQAAFAAARELLGFESGAISPQVAEGDTGLHIVAIDPGTELVLGLDRRRERFVRVILIDVRRKPR